MERRYSPTHEWVVLEGTVATIGISDHAQKTLGDIVFADLPKPGTQVKVGSECVVLESMKAASPVHAPFSGVISEINVKVTKKQELINTDPTENGWLFKIAIDNPETTAQMSESDYLTYLTNQ